MLFLTINFVCVYKGISLSGSSFCEASHIKATDWIMFRFEIILKTQFKTEISISHFPPFPFLFL